MSIEIFKNLVLNLSFLAVLAQLLTRVKLIKDTVYEQSLGQQKLLKQFGLVAIFSVISIISTYTGQSVHGAIANMRATGVIAAGIIGGPLVGILTSIIAGIHRYISDIEGFTAVACGISTIVEGLIGAWAYKQLKSDRWRKDALFFLGVCAEVLQMVIILMVAKPYESAVQLVRLIGIPMILFNSVGLIVFVSLFKSIFVGQVAEKAKGIRSALEISEKCLPILRKGIDDHKEMKKVAEIIMNQGGYQGILVYNQTQLVAASGAYIMIEDLGEELPQLVTTVMKNQKVKVIQDYQSDRIGIDNFEGCTLIGAPLKREDEVIGCLVALVTNNKISIEADEDFIIGLSKILSIQLELSEVDRQKSMRQKAEFMALQSQINPHFLFNSLNTITFFCREKPERARELLMILSRYFRKTLDTRDYMINIYEEFDHVNAYLQLEKARFEENLTLDIHIGKDLNCLVPTFILQPIVENAVKHGAMKQGKGKITLLAKKNRRDVIVVVKDSGQGMEKEIIERLYNDTLDHKKVGLVNVHKRLIGIYGKDYGLNISSSSKGTKVIIKIPIKEQLDESISS